MGSLPLRVNDHVKGTWVVEGRNGRVFLVLSVEEVEVSCVHVGLLRVSGDDGSRRSRSSESKGTLD